MKNKNQITIELDDEAEAKLQNLIKKNPGFTLDEFASNLLIKKHCEDKLRALDKYFSKLKQ